MLSAIESRALIYQGILITTETEKKVKLINALKNSFKNEGIENAFDLELRVFLKEIKKEEVPSNFTSFYNNILAKIKLNQLILK